MAFRKAVIAHNFALERRSPPLHRTTRCAAWENYRWDAGNIRYTEGFSDGNEGNSLGDPMGQRWGYSNRQRVDFVWKYFSHNANTTLGRTAKTGSFIERMSSFIFERSQSYLRS